MRTRSPERRLFYYEWEHFLVRSFWLIVRLSLLATLLTLAHISQALPKARTLVGTLSNQLCELRVCSTMSGTSEAATVKSPAKAAKDAAAPGPEDKDHDHLRKIFSGIRMQKHDEFPSLLRQENGTYTKIGSADILPWTNGVGQWCAAHGASGIDEITDLLVHLSEDGNQKLPLFEDKPEGNDLNEST